MTDLLDLRPPADGGETGYAEVLAAFKEVARVATGAGTPGRLDQLLRLVGQRICELIKVRRCSVYLHAGEGVFHGRVGYCATDRIDDRIKPLISGIEGDRFTREIVERRAPVLVTDACHDDRTIQRTMRRWGVQDMLGVPLTFADEVIGIIYIDDLQNGHVYTDHEIHVAQTFANLAALAIREASLFSQLNQRAVVIDKQRRMLHQVTEAHERLTQAVLSGMGLDGIADLIVDIVNRPVLAYNEHLELMIERVPAGVEPEAVFGPGPSRGRDGALRRSLAAMDATKASVILAPAPGEGYACRQLACPMVVDGRTVGYLVLLEVGRPFCALDTRVGEHGATVLTLQLLIELRQIAARDQAREELLADTLDGGRDREAVLRRSRVLGVELGAPHVVVRVTDGTDLSEGAARAGRRSRLARAIGAGLGTAEPLSASFPGAHLFLVPLPAGPEMAALRRVKAAVEAAVAGEDGTERIAVISTPCRSAADYPGVSRELQQLAEMLLGFCRPGAQVQLAGELGVLRLLSANVTPPEALAFSRELLRPLVAHDREAGGDLTSTMRVFLEHGGRVRATAKHLAVHENTIRYRLARVKELSALDPDRMETLLDLRFAFQVLDMAGEALPGPADRPCESEQSG